MKNYAEWDDIVKIVFAIIAMSMCHLLFTMICDITATQKISELKERIVVLETRLRVQSSEKQVPILEQGGSTNE